MSKVFWLNPEDPVDRFPSIKRALRHPDGLLAAGGDLSTPRLLAAYAKGIFPWYEDSQPILWWSPDPRAVFFPDALRISRSLKKTLRQNRFEISFDRAFSEVVQGCAEPRSYGTGTWITAEMMVAYNRLHEEGHAHSIEVWDQNGLAGGLYGLTIGKVFFGESMFSQARDASKVALVRLAEELTRREFALLDCQVDSPHLQSLGATLLRRSRFLALLEEHCTAPEPVGSWAQERGRAQPASA